MKYKAVIGLETHIQLNTKTKIFCSCKNMYGADANTLTCPVCLGHPGALPVLNKEVIDKAIMVALSLNCSINKESKFDRKNYFYPDLPKGYQISQYDQPIAYEGYIEINSGNNIKKIDIIRIHIEEDTGKLIHDEKMKKNISYIDFNRCGIPLIEIVTKPNIESPDETISYLNKLKDILEYIGVSNCNMEEGSLRCDANISVMKIDSDTLGTKVEIKNMNSFKSIKSAIEYEIKRQIEILKCGKEINQETRLWDVDSISTKLMRKKEGEDDYRYFPEPDLVPFTISDDYISNIKNKLPELREAKIKRFKETYNLPDYDCEILTETKELADYYEKTVSSYPSGVKKISNWIMSKVLAVLNDKHIDINNFSIIPKNLAVLVELIDKDVISEKIAKKVFSIMVNEGGKPKDIIKKLNLKLINNSNEIRNLIDGILETYPKEVEKYKSGKKNIMEFFIGEVMKKSQGKAKPQIVNKILREKLES